MLSLRIVDRVVARLTQALAPPRGPLIPFMVDGHEAGYLTPERAAWMSELADVFTLDDGVLRFVRHLDSFASRTGAVASVTRMLAGRRALTHWRNERYRVSPSLDGAPLFDIERAAARYFGIATHAAHVNATVDAGDAGMWIARRSGSKPVDAGLLDNLVGGGVAAGMSIADTVVKEAWEEAGIDERLARDARRSGTVRLFREQPDGIQRETVHVFDLDLPREFVPSNQDGEVAEYRLAMIEDVVTWIGNDEGRNVVTADASLVIVDWLLRHDRVPRSWPAFATLSRLRGG